MIRTELTIRQYNEFDSNVAPHVFKTVEIFNSLGDMNARIGDINATSSEEVVDHEWVEVSLEFEAQMSNVGTDGDVEFVAAGRGSDGERYRVTWDTLPQWDGEQCDDACDWDHPSKIELA